MNLLFDRSPVLPGQWLHEFTDKNLASPTRSTLPLLDALRQQPPASFLNALLDSADLNPPTADLHLEYQVAPPAGRSNAASHTDLMAIEAAPTNRSLAIEAKWTEPRYDTVAKWLTQGNSAESREKVLRGWLDLLEPHAAASLSIRDADELIYQMVHRAASAAAACSPGGRPAMAYLFFHENPDASHLNEYRADLSHFHTTLGNPQGFPFFLASVPIEPTAAYHPLAGLEKGETATGQTIRQALQPGEPPLFTFGEPQIEVI